MCTINTIPNTPQIGYSDNNKRVRKQSKTEKKFVDLANHLPPLTSRQIQYGQKKFENVGIYTGHSMWCQCCGKTFKPSKKGFLTGRITKECCPECGAILDEIYPKRTDKYNNDSVLVTYITTFKGYVVFRTFEFDRSNTLYSPTKYTQHEVYQNWVTPDGKEVITGRRYSRGVNFFSWDYNSDYAQKRHNGNYCGYYVFDDVFATTYNNFYPYSRVTPILKRNGWSSKLIKLGYGNAKFMVKLMKDPNVEYLIKTKNFEILLYYTEKGLTEIPYKHAVKIATKNGYKVKDAVLWFDYLELLDYFHKDTHNAHYVCPSDLRKEHDRYMMKKRIIEKREKMIESYKQTKEYEETYKSRMAMFIGIAFDDGNIFVHVLESVKEFLEEGTAMEHCVYNNGYYKRKNTLILSARNANNERVETVEVNTKTWEIVQSRGHCNQRSEFHDEIVNLINGRIPYIRSTARRKVKESVKQSAPI